MMLAPKTKLFARLVLTLLTLMTLGSNAALAGRVIMLNGDIITGEIKEIWDAELSIEPEYADEFTVDTDEISHIESEREFDILLPDGREVRIKPVGGANGNQLIEVDGKIKEVPFMQLVELDELEDFYDWDTFIDLNSTVEKGNTESKKATLKLNTNLKLGDHRHIGDILFAREEQSGLSTKEQDLVQYAYNWSFNEPWFAAGNASWERDPIKALDKRINVGGGIGYDIWDSARRFFQVQGVTGWQTETVNTIDSDGIIGGWILRINYNLIGGDLKLFHNHSYNVAFSGRRNNVFKSQTGARYEITDLLYLNFELDFDHESQPAIGAEPEDISILLGIGVEL
jgi:putative salt-induced outer membrane protein YdiY